MIELHESIPAALDGERLDRVVSFLTGISRSRASAAIDGGLVLLDAEPVLIRSRRVQVGEELTVRYLEQEEERQLRPDPDIESTVVHEDAEVLVVDKHAAPAGRGVAAGQAGGPDRPSRGRRR